jgi:hypothetical protein
MYAERRGLAVMKNLFKVHDAYGDSEKIGSRDMMVNLTQANCGVLRTLKED